MIKSDSIGGFSQRAVEQRRTGRIQIHCEVPVSEHLGTC
jgi:hypothetical protein